MFKIGAMDDGRSDEIPWASALFDTCPPQSATTQTRSTTCTFLVSLLVIFLLRTNLQRSYSACYKSHRRIIYQFINLAIMPSQTPEEMFADKSYDGWEELSPRQKVERMFSIHKSGHEEGEDVSFTVSISVFYVQPSVRERHNYPVLDTSITQEKQQNHCSCIPVFPNPSRQNPIQLQKFSCFGMCKKLISYSYFFSALQFEPLQRPPRRLR